MLRAEIRDGYVWLIDSASGEERHFFFDLQGHGVQAATVSGDDEVTIRTEYGGGTDTKYRISTSERA